MRGKMKCPHGVSGMVGKSSKNDRQNCRPIEKILKTRLLIQGGTCIDVIRLSLLHLFSNYDAFSN